MFLSLNDNMVIDVSRDFMINAISEHWLYVQIAFLKRAQYSRLNPNAARAVHEAPATPEGQSIASSHGEPAAPAPQTQSAPGTPRREPALPLSDGPEVVAWVQCD